MNRSISFIQMGLGPVGQQIVRYAVERSGLHLAAVVDTDPAKAGQDMGSILGCDSKGISVVADGAAALSVNEADVVIVATVSSMEMVETQILLCIEYGNNVVSTAEELAFPWETHPEIARRIDEAAKEKGVTVLATGVNPGLTMDTLPLTLSGVCRRIDRIYVQRHQDAAIRRLPFQRKIGVGLSPEEFSRLAAGGFIRHLGFPESIRMIACGLGWELESIEEEILPVIAGIAVDSPFLRVAAGQAAGVFQTAKGFVKGKAVITLELEAYIGHPAPKDAITIEGDPPVYSEVRGGINGDVATCAMIVNALPRVVASSPGLKTMPEIGTVSWYSRL